MCILIVEIDVCACVCDVGYRVIGVNEAKTEHCEQGHPCTHVVLLIYLHSTSSLTSVFRLLCIF